ncbi:TolB family protein [Deinococcus altitudinis]|uniref:TolB family protein n=1 Tax=Deinococcus altitudinis TaxID=468914 RepID=UPI0038927237
MRPSALRAAATALGLFAAALPGLTLAAAPGTPQAALTRVTSGGCCTGTVWTPDSRALLYIDRPPGTAKAAMYSVPATGGAAPSVRFSRVAFYSPDLKYAAIPQGNSTVVERLSDKKRWILNTQGAQLLWGPQGRVSYTVSAQSGNYDRRVSRVYALTLGEAPRLVATLYGGGAVAWLGNAPPGGGTLLLSGKLEAASKDRQLFTVNLQGGARRTLASALNLRGIQPSPDGKWVAYSVAFDSAARDGMFVQPTGGGPARRLNWFGSYQWRGSGSLLYIPLTLNVPTHTVRLYDLGTFQSRPLLNLGTKVQSGDWQASPDGQKVAFRRAGDGNIYVAALP